MTIQTKEQRLSYIFSIKDITMKRMHKESGISKVCLETITKTTKCALGMEWVKHEWMYIPDE